MATAVIEQPKIENEPTLSNSLLEKRRRITVEEYPDGTVRHAEVDPDAFDLADLNTALSGYAKVIQS